MILAPVQYSVYIAQESGTRHETKQTPTPRGNPRYYHTHGPVSRQRLVAFVALCCDLSVFLLALFYIVAGFPIQNGRRSYESARDACLLFIPLTAAYLGPCRNPRISLNETIFYIGDNLVIGTFLVFNKPPDLMELPGLCSGPYGHAQDGPPPCITFTG